ncbi:DUF3653 domain-containing protein [Stenotrophomonas maltophilia]|uniref:DUF3653 domain-containing protein n=1 Tax=Stenotrophomonas maltophilia TaxID=40324 RepID=UPI002ACCDA8D|nr:DUF3653 domain-containing protein [Stenotrophomonas maltophilia]MDZ5777862.1 DUF3653 domain-containing protein [Stenotrophomonas maltophilia]
MQATSSDRSGAQLGTQGRAGCGARNRGRLRCGSRNQGHLWGRSGNRGRPCGEIRADSCGILGVSVVAVSQSTSINCHAEPTKAAAARYSISHNVYYVQGDPGVAGTHLASTLSPAVAWSLIVRDRNLTGPWAGFSFKAGRLVTPEGRELEPQDLAWLSLLAAQAQEWRRMMEIARGGQKRPFGRAGIVDLAEVAHRRAKRSSGVTAGPDADPVAGVLPVPGPMPRQRV